MKKIFVCGAGGYIGIPLCERLLEAGYAVTGFDRYFFGRELLAPVEALEKFTPLVGDIRDVNESMLAGHDAVIDLAGLSNDASADIDVGLTQAINNRGGVRLAQVAQDDVLEAMRADRDPRAHTPPIVLTDGDNAEWCRGAAVLAIQAFVLGGLPSDQAS